MARGVRPAPTPQTAPTGTGRLDSLSKPGRLSFFLIFENLHPRPCALPKIEPALSRLFGLSAAADGRRLLVLLSVLQVPEAAVLVRLDAAPVCRVLVQATFGVAALQVLVSAATDAHLQRAHPVALAWAFGVGALVSGPFAVAGDRAGHAGGPRTDVRVARVAVWKDIPRSADGKEKQENQRTVKSENVRSHTSKKSDKSVDTNTQPIPIRWWEKGQKKIYSQVGDGLLKTH